MHAVTKQFAVIRMGWCAVAVLAIAGSLSSAAAAADAPPVNDDYLTSLRLEDAHSRTPRAALYDVQEASAATVQADLLLPEHSGGGGAEPTSCDGVAYGRTIWYDIRPDQHGAIRLQSAGRDGVIALYEWNPRTLHLGTRIRCVNQPGLQDELDAWLDKGKSYTVQLGGVDDGTGPAGGQVQFTEQFLDDSDRDEVIDLMDKCVGTKGTSKLKGCLPEVNVVPTLNWRRYDVGVAIRELSVVDHTRRGGRAVAWLSGGRSFTHRLRDGKASFTDNFSGFLPLRSMLTVVVTRPGAIGERFRWSISSSGIGPRQTSCLLPGTRRPPRHHHRCQ